MRGEILYRGFEIYLDGSMDGVWLWVHTEYDGPEDSRTGWEWSRSACFEAVDEYLEENGDGDE